MLLLTVFALLIPSTLGVTGVDVSTAVSQTAWKCLQSPGGQGPIKFAVARVYSELGHVDTTGIESLKAARAAGSIKAEVRAAKLRLQRAACKLAADDQQRAALYGAGD